MKRRTTLQPIPPNPSNKGIRDALRQLGVGKYIRVPARTRSRYYSECAKLGKKCVTRATKSRKGDTEPMVRVYVSEILPAPSSSPTEPTEPTEPADPTNPAA